MSLLAHRVIGEKKMRQECRDEGEMGWGYELAVHG
jgi:hypothetical protein